MLNPILSKTTQFERNEVTTAHRNYLRESQRQESPLVNALHLAYSPIQKERELGRVRHSENRLNELTKVRMPSNHLDVAFQDRLVHKSRRISDITFSDRDSPSNLANEDMEVQRITGSSVDTLGKLITDAISSTPIGRGTEAVVYPLSDSQKLLIRICPQQNKYHGVDLKDSAFHAVSVDFGKETLKKGDASFQHRFSPISFGRRSLTVRCNATRSASSDLGKNRRRTDTPPFFSVSLE